MFVDWLVGWLVGWSGLLFGYLGGGLALRSFMSQPL